MYLYNLTLQKPTAVYQSICGNFSGNSKVIEIVLNHGRSLEMIRYDEDGKMSSVHYTEVFGVIRSIIPFRLTSGTKDYIIVGSDSGRVVILEYNTTKNQFDKVHQETFGRSGCRRIVPGQYLAVDPKGRAFMIGAIEKQKLVYILNRDSSAKLTISSPLEAHKSNTIVFSMCGVDVGFENPIFATISVDYSEDGGTSIEDLDDMDTNGGKRKVLTYYELDLGLNNVVRKWSDQIDDTSNIVITVPGSNEGPGGVLVTSEDYICYRNQDHPEIRAKIPRRFGSNPDKGLLIVSYSSHKQKGMFFFLVQSEFGDLYKITLDYKGETVTQVNISYFDTIPLANSLTVLKNGFLFSASEFGDHSLYFFKSLGDDDDNDDQNNGEQTEVGGSKMIEKDGFIWFKNREELKNLQQTSTLSSLSPIVDFKVLDIVREENPQLYSLCGTSKDSSLKVLRHGLSVTTITNANLPGVPSGIWTVPKSTVPVAGQDPTDKYIVVSFVGSTSVLSVGETIQENHESGILESTTTLLIGSMGEDSILQVYPTGFRFIRSDMRTNEWRAPGRKTIVRATSNQNQLVIALSGGEVIYFELDQSGGLTEIIKKDFRRDIACIEISPVPKGRGLARFLAISDWEGPVRILSLDRDNCLGQISMLDTDNAYIESLSIVEMNVNEAGVDNFKVHQSNQSGIGSGSGSLFLFIGLKNGVIKRATLDNQSGELSDIRTRLLGRKPVKLFKIKVKGSNGVLALSSRVWLNYANQGKLEIVPLSIEPLENASNLSSNQSLESVVATSENRIIIFTIDKLGELFNQELIKLDSTPRRFIIHPQTNYIIILETETNYNTEQIDIDQINQEKVEQYELKKKELQENLDMEMDMGDQQQNIDEEINSSIKKPKLLFKPKAGKGQWRSLIKIIDPITHQILDSYQLDENEAGFSLCTLSFSERGDGEIYLVVGCGNNVVLNPKSCESASINLYKFIDNGKKLELVYKTETEEPVYAMAAFQGRLCAGVGKNIRIYDMGKKKLLRKCETKNLPNTIVNIHSLGDRLVVGDIQESMHFIKYKKVENMLYVFADDLAPRWVTSSVMLDYDTVAGADKFGNVFILRLPSNVSDEVEEDPTGSKLRFESGLLNGAPHKLEHIANIFAGDAITTLNKTSLVVGGSEVVLYTTISGAIGALIPFVSREDVDFFSTLELQLRNEHQPLCGRDHLAYRSYYFPVKNIIDGDLCEQFLQLDPSKQRQIAEELSRSPSEVLKKLEDIRSQRLL